MCKIFKIISIFSIMTLVGCSPAMRIKPGELLPAEVADRELRVEAEHYIASHTKEENYTPIRSGKDYRRVKVMVDRLSVAAGYQKGVFPLHLLDAGQNVNAAAVNGASIIVYKELLSKVNSDDELATILAHEIGHIMGKHYQDRKEEESRGKAVSVASSIFGTVASVATSLAGFGGVSSMAGDLTETTTGMVGYGAFVGSFSRVQEYEADHLGLLIMAKAGYDPKIAIGLWERAEEIFGSSNSSVGAFFSTHPASSDRAEELEKALPYAEKLYKGKSKTAVVTQVRQLAFAIVLKNLMENHRPLS